MTNDQQQAEAWRDEFESGMKLNYPKVSLIRSGDGYFGSIAEGAYMGFLMARRNHPVIELPEYIMCDDQKWIEPSEMMDAITAAGYSYRVKS